MPQNQPSGELLPGARPRPRARTRRTLTPRELAVIEGIAHGRSDKEIAHDLGLSLPTVRTYVGRAIVKLDARNRQHAVAKAVRQKLVR